jgi:hypothetical protein
MAQLRRLVNNIISLFHHSLGYEATGFGKPYWEKNILIIITPWPLPSGSIPDGNDQPINGLGNLFYSSLFSFRPLRFYRFGGSDLFDIYI